MFSWGRPEKEKSAGWAIQDEGTRIEPDALRKGLDVAQAMHAALSSVS